MDLYLLQKLNQIKETQDENLDPIEIGYEYKVVRNFYTTTFLDNLSGGFSDVSLFEKTVKEEESNGWELLRKIDNNRLKFKRKLNTPFPPYPNINPYRTTINYNVNKNVWLISLALLIVVFVFAFFLYLYS